MRTVSAKYPKGHEPPRTIFTNLRLIRYMIAAGLNYLIKGRSIRREWYGKQRAGQKFYVDQA